MPFSFKPTQEGEVPQGENVTSPVSSPSDSLSFVARADGESRGIVQIFLFVVLTICIITVIGLFGYNYYLNSQIDIKKLKLVEYDTRLKSFPIQEVSALSGRLKTVKQLINEHSSVNMALALVEKSTEFPITYRRFNLHFSDGTRTYELALAAIAPDYHSVIEQMDTLKSLEPFTSYIKSVTISNLHPDDTGKISFNLTMPISITGPGATPEEFLVRMKNTEGQPTVPVNGSSTASTTPSVTASTSVSTIEIVNPFLSTLKTGTSTKTASTTSGKATNKAP